MSNAAFGKRDRLHVGKAFSASGLSALLLLSQSAPLLANPTGGAVVAGSATIGAAGKTLTINQASNLAIINWQSFSIASGETTKFLVPTSASATLNRVTGGNPSAIFGTLQSNGHLFLLNPSGILVGAGGRIDTAGFLGSTLNASDSEFLKNGDLHFSGDSTATFDNQGSINATNGDVYLIANQVSNNGSITAPQGNVGLAAGLNVLYQQAGDQHLFVQSSPAGTTRAVGVTNSGTIQAASAELRAAGGNAYALAINNTGSVAATGYKKINGQVYLTADTGTISNSGKIRATGSKQGGTIQLTSQTGTITNSGTLDASATGIGGKGGSILLKSTQGSAANTSTGQIYAKGGTHGSGGQVELSGGTVSPGGIVNTTALHGQTGMFTIDPGTLTIGGAGNETGAQVGTALNQNNVTLNADTTVTINDAISWTGTTTLTLSTNSTSGSTIAINQAISGTSGTLTLDTASATDQITTGASGSVNVSSFILQNGSWTQNSSTLPGFTASNDFELQGSSSFLRVTGGNGTSSPYQITDIYGLQGLGSPSKTYFAANAELVNDIDASTTANWNTGDGFVPIGIYDGSNSSDSNAYQGTFNGQNHTISGLTVDLPNSEATGLFGDTGNNATVENVTLTNVDVTGNVYVGGLVGVNDATVTNCVSTGTVVGLEYVGGLLGINAGAVSSSSTSGLVTGVASCSAVGGLVGYSQFGSITSCSSSAIVAAGTNSFDVGGLVGISNITVSNSSTTGAVAGHEVVGGLVGWNDGGTVTGSHSSATVVGDSSSFDIGGLIGTNEGTLGSSYASGQVSGINVVGGLVGWNDSGSISAADATGSVTGTSQVGGLVGTNEGSLTNGFSTGSVSGTSPSLQVGGLVGWNDSGTITNSYTASPVSVSGSSSQVGGLLGANTGSSTITNTFWDTDTAGVTQAVGDTGSATFGVISATTAQLKNQGDIISLSTGTPAWAFGTVWTTNSNTTLPQLIGVGTGTTTGTGTDTLTGTAYTNSGITIAPGVTITLIFDGSVLGTTSTNSSGLFSFNVSPTDLGGGLLLTDATNKGDTFFQSGSTSTSFTGIDIWGSTLRIMADTASNAALKTAIGSLSGNGINYSVSGANLSTTSGVSLSILSGYNIDGNLTASGTLNTGSSALLTGSANATLQGTSVTLSGGLNRTGSLTVDSTSGAITLTDLGSSQGAAVVHGMTLNATGAVLLDNTFLTLGGGNFSATGTGYTSTTNASGEANGVNLFDSTILAQGGNITLTGTAGYTSPGGGVINAGLGVAIGTDGSTPVELSTTGTGNITITGTFNQNVTSASYFAAVDIYSDSPSSNLNELSVANGTISVTGTVTQGKADGTAENAASIGGVTIGSSTLLNATGTGSISLTGNTTNATSQVSSGNFSFIQGVEVSGNLTAATGSITIHGNSGTINTSNSTATGGLNTAPFSAGVVVDSNAQITTTGSNTTVSITGTGGPVVTTGAFTGASEGVTLEGSTVLSMGTNGTLAITGTSGAVNAGNGANSGDAESRGVHLSGNISVLGGGSVNVTGTGGTLDISHATAATDDNVPTSEGITLGGDGTLTAQGTTTVTFTGTGGNVTSSSANKIGGSIGINVGNNKSDVELISSESGLIKFTGVAGTTPSLGIGVVIHGFDGTSASVTSTSGNIQIMGTGGAGYTGTGTTTGNYVPNEGVGIFDDASVETGGAITITGAGGANSGGVIVNELTNDSILDASPLIPIVDATGALTITSTAGRVILDSITSGGSTTITSPGTLTIDNTAGGTALTTGALTANAAGDVDLNAPIAASGTATIATTGGDITFGTNGTISDSGTGNNITLAAGTSLPHSHYIINDSSSGANAIQVSNGAQFYLFSADPTSDTFNGIAVPVNNVVFNATFPANNLPTGNGELFYVANAQATGPNIPGGGNTGGGGTGTGTGGGTGGGGGTGTTTPPSSVASSQDGSGSNVVPPAIVTQNDDLQPPTSVLGSIWGGSLTPPFSFTGSASTSQISAGPGGLADASGNGSIVGPGDETQSGKDGLGNVTNPAASDTLGLALGPAVHNVLNQALASLGDWTDTTDVGPDDNTPAAHGAGGGNETDLVGGEVAELTKTGGKKIPLSQAPEKLKQAMGNDVLGGMPGH